MEVNMKRVAVIGAGVSGIVSIKACLEEGLEPVCFEQHDQPGGLWYYTPDLRHGQVSAMYQSVILNVPKQLTSFSDYLFSKEDPIFPGHQRVHEYLKEYVNVFDLEKYIKYNRRVVKVSPSEDHQVSGKWTVQVHNTESDDVERDTFDGVMMCTGGFGDVYMPKIPGIKDFKGTTLHANLYREPSPYKGKRVIVVGAGNTAGECACELGRYDCAKVYISVRNGTNVAPRLTKSGLPYMMVITNRAGLTFMSRWRDRIISEHLLTGEDNRFGLAPRDPSKPVSFMVNDEIHTSIAAGKVTVIPEISKYTTNGVILSDGRVHDDIDVVIFATGYQKDYKTLEGVQIFDRNGTLALYKYIVPIDLKHPSLVFISAVGTFTPSSWNTDELQARWGARLINGRLSLPSKSQMERDIYSRPTMTKHHKSLECTLYQDELARDIGVLPSVWKLLFTDPRLAYAYFFGPTVGPWYRLQGSASWNGARDAILNTWENTLYPLNPTPKPRETWKSFIWRNKRDVLIISMIGVGLVVASQRCHVLANNLLK